jgi:hypothetical protein
MCTCEGNKQKQENKEIELYHTKDEGKIMS